MQYQSFGPVLNPDGTPSDITKQMLSDTGRSLYRLYFNGYSFMEYVDTTGPLHQSKATLNELVEGEFNSLGDCINHCMGEYGNVPSNFENLDQIIVNILSRGRWLISFSDESGREMIHTAEVTI